MINSGKRIYNESNESQVVDVGFTRRHKSNTRICSESSVNMFESTGVMTKKELEARNEVKWETYTKKVQIESRVLGDLAMSMIIPVATQYQTQLVDNAFKLKQILPADRYAEDSK